MLNHGSRKLRGAAFAIADQFASSGLLILVLIATAREASAEHLGQFVLLQSVAATLTYGYRAVPAAWTLMAPRRGLLAEERALLSGSVSLAILIGVVGGLVIGLASLIARIDSWYMAIAFVVSAPALTGMVAVRMHFYRQQTPAAAAAMSVSAAVLLTAGVLNGGLIPGVPGWVAPSVVLAAISWLVLLASLAVTRWHASLPAFSRVVRLGRHDWAAATSNLILISARQIGVPSMVGIFGGLSAAAGLRGAQTLAGFPLQVPQGLQPMFLASAARHYTSTGSYPRRQQNLWTASQIALTLPLVGLAFFVPEDLGLALLGESWTYAESALPWVVIAALITQLSVGQETTLRVVGKLRLLVIIRAVAALPTLVLVSIGAGQHGATGAALGLLCANALVWLVTSSVVRPLIR